MGPLLDMKRVLKDHWKGNRGDRVKSTESASKVFSRVREYCLVGLLSQVPGWTEGLVFPSVRSSPRSKQKGTCHLYLLSFTVLGMLLFALLLLFFLGGVCSFLLGAAKRNFFFGGYHTKTRDVTPWCDVLCCPVVPFFPLSAGEGFRFL